MNLVYILLYPVCIAAISLASATIKKNKLYIIYNYGADFIYELNVYELKNGTTRDIFNSRKSYNITITGSKLDLEFSDAPEILPEASNKLWLKADQTFYGSEISGSNSSFKGYINIDDMSFNTDISSVKFLSMDKFPQFGYTMNKITNEYGSALYITGGVIYSKSLGTYISSNSFFKYNYTTNEWVDMASKYSGNLDPIYNHKSAVMDNRYLLLFGGIIAKDSTDDASLNTANKGLFKLNSIYKLTRFDTFNNSWENISLNTSMFDSSIASLQLSEFSANFYNNKFYILGGLAASNEKQAVDLNSKLGILDYKESQWSWSPVLDDNSSVYNSSAGSKYCLIYNDQMILISGKPVEKDSDRFQVFDLISLRMKPTMKASYMESDTKNSTSTGPPSSEGIYNLIAITVGFTVVIMLIIFYLYMKYNRIKIIPQNRNSEQKKSMEAVWSNPEDPNMEYILYGFKENEIQFNSEIKHSDLKLENPSFEMANNSQEYFTPSLGTINSSTTLCSNSSNYSTKNSSATLS